MHEKGHGMNKKIWILLMGLSLMMVSCDSRSASELYSDAEEMINQDKFEEALKDLQRVEKKFPENELAPKSVYRMAELYMNEMKDLNSAIETYQKVADNYSESTYGAKSRFMAGFLLANNTSRFDEAKAQYELFLTTYPNDELTSAVQFEMENLGKDIDEIPQLKGLVEGESQGADK